jgi:acyl-CoA thioesterase FadM
MNLYFRLLRLLFRTLWPRAPEAPLGTTVLAFRAWPLDLDYNLHVTNARYQSFMDLGRTWHLLATGLWRPVLKKRWLPILHACHVTYLKQIDPFQKFELHTSLEGWDEKYFYMRQEFRRGDDLCAIGLVRGVFRHGRRSIPTSDLLAWLQAEAPTINMNDLTSEWQAFLKVQRDQS